MKAFLIILLAIITSTIFYVSYRNLKDASFFNDYTFTNPDGEHFVETIIKTSDIFITKNNSAISYDIETSDGRKVELKADNTKVQDFFKDWKEINGDLQAPSKCNFLNIVTEIKNNGIQDVNDIFIRIYCSLDAQPNLRSI